MGLGLSKPPSALPDLEGTGQVSRPSSRASLRRQVSAQPVLPVLPLRPGTPAGVRAAGRGEEVLGIDGEETPTRVGKGGKGGGVGDVLGAAAPAMEVGKKEGKDAGAESVNAQAKEVEGAKAVVEPAAKVPEPARQRKSSAPTSIQPASKGQATVQASSAKAAPVTPSKSESKKEEVQKRKHPGKLDISAAVKKQEKAVAATPVDTGTPASRRTVSQTPSMMSKPESPGGTASSPVVKSAPRTLRLTQTPKTEIPPAQPFPTPSLPTPAAVSAAKLPSRQPSVASINPMPGTPSSEQVSISDNISVASTSLSRANSPPPGKVGSAPVRAKTKNQMKKERQERAKVLEEEKGKKVEGEEGAKTPVPALLEETAQEAIVSRKKKEKKAKAPAKARVASATADTTPTESRPPSPGVKAVVEEVVKAAPAPTPVVEPKVMTPTKTLPAAPVTPTATVMAGPAPHEPSPPPTPTLTAQALLKELQATAPELQKCIDSLFRTPGSAHFKATHPITPKDLQDPHIRTGAFGHQLSKKEVDALLEARVPAVTYGGEDGSTWSKGMVTQTGAHLRALTEELEQRFLELEKALKEMPEQLRFRPSKPQNEMKFPAMDLEALKRRFESLGQRGVSVMEQMVQEGSTKKGAFLVDEASKYINEFVMPPVTPPPSAGKVSAGTGVVGTGSAEVVVAMPPGLEIAERSLGEAKRVMEEKEGQLKKVIKKNRRLLGLG